MLTDPSHTELLIEEKRPVSRKLVAVIAALVVTALVISGYLYLRGRHVQQMAAAVTPVPESSPTVPKGPAKAHILVDDAMLKGGQTIIGGSVKNISGERLVGLSVGLELRRRKDASLEQVSAPVAPTDLDPEQEGRYLLNLPAQEYSSVRLANLRVGDSTLIAFSSAQGQKRPPERLEPKTVTVPRSPSKGGDFLNTPDNPARVP